MNRMKEPVLVAFSTASSEAAYPKTMLQLERFGCKEKIVSFIKNAFDYINFHKEGVNQLNNIISVDKIKHIESTFLELSDKSKLISFKVFNLKIPVIPIEVSTIIFVKIGKEIVNEFIPLSDHDLSKRLFRELTWVLKGEGSYVKNNCNQIIGESIHLSPPKGWKWIELISQKILQKCNFYKLNGSLEYSIHQVLNLKGKK